MPLGSGCLEAERFRVATRFGVKGRKCRAIEIEPKYFDIACRRIADAYRQANLFIKQPEVA